MANGQITPREEDVLIREWQTVIHYWAGDNSVQVTLCTVFILINSILFALIAIAPSDSVLPTWVLRYFGPSLGIFINIIWGVLVTRMVAYLRYYYNLAADIQKKIPLLQFPDSPLLKYRWYQKISSNTLLQYVPILFAIVWIIILIALIN